LNYFSLIYNLREIIKELSFVFARKPLSKNKGTRARAPQLLVTKFRRSMHAALRTISVLSKGLKKLKRNQAEIQVSDAN